jgi:hypothetical protein
LVWPAGFLKLIRAQGCYHKIIGKYYPILSSSAIEYTKFKECIYIQSKAFSALASDPTKSRVGAMTENGKGKARKLNGQPASANQLSDGEDRLKQNYLQKDCTLNDIFSHNLSV